MINLTVTSNLTRKTIIVSGNTTINEAFAKAGIDHSRGLVSLDGCNIGRNDYGKTLDELGCGESATLMSIIKNDNAR